MISNHPIHKAIGFQIFKSNIEGVINQDFALEKFQTRQETTLNDKLHGLKIDRLEQIFYHIIKQKILY